MIKSPIGIFRIFSVFAAAAASLIGLNLQAATISWSSPVVFSSLTTAQIFTNTPGTIVGAVGFGIEEPTAVTYSTNHAPVVFDIFADPTVASLTGTNGVAYGTGTFPAATAYTTGNTNFDSVLNNFAFNNKILTIKLINLVPGATYSVQLFSVDDRTGSASNTVSFQNATNAVNSSSTYTSGTNAYVVGTFTVPTNSTGALTNFTIQQNLSSTNGVINALVLRAVSFTPVITFTQQPTNSTYVDLGSNVSFSAMAYGPAPIVPHWVYGPSGGPYTNLTETSHYIGTGTYDLTISNVNSSDANYVYALSFGTLTNYFTNSITNTTTNFQTTTITSAIYETTNATVQTNVTSAVAAKVTNGYLHIQVLPATFGISDPAPGTGKKLVMNYVLNGTNLTTNAPDYTYVTVGAPIVISTTNSVTNSTTNTYISTPASLSVFGVPGGVTYVPASSGLGAVNSAIASTYYNGGGTVLMGPGSFYGTLETYPNVWVKGSGVSNTIIEGGMVDGYYGFGEYLENFSVYGGVSASSYEQGGYPGAGAFFGNPNSTSTADYSQFFKNIEIEGCNIAMQQYGNNGIYIINCNFHDNGLGFSHSIYFTGDYNVNMINSYSSWSTAGDGVHNDFAGSVAAYTYTQCDYSGNEGYGLLVQDENGDPPHLNMYGCTIQFNGQDGGDGKGLNCNSQGAVECSRLDWNNGLGFDGGDSEVLVNSTVFGNGFSVGNGGQANLINTTTQFVYDAALADAIAGPNNTGDWVNPYNGYGGGATEGNVAFINGNHPVDGYITWSAIGAPANGSYPIQVWYANGLSNTLAMPMTVNGAYVGTQLFPPTGSWSTFTNNAGITANLTSSNNSVSLSVLSPGLGAPILQALYVPTATPSLPATPTGLTAVPDTNAPTVFMYTWEKLSWNPVPGATAYNIYRLISGNPIPVAKNVPSTSYTFKHILGCGTTQSFRVSGVNQAGEGGSASVTCISIACFPLTCTATGGSNQDTVSWSASPNAKSYTVYRSTVSGGPYKKIATTTKASYIDLNIVSGTTYYYTVSATDGNTMSMNSPESAGVKPYSPFNGTGLINIDFGSDALQTGAAVLGTNGDLWNAAVGNISALVTSVGAPATGIGLTFGGSGVYTDSGGTAMDATTTPLMEDYAYGYTGATPKVSVSLTGLTVGSTFTLVVYAAGDNVGQGTSLTLSGASGGNSASTLNTSATSRQISQGNGVAYQTYTGKVTNGTLTVTATELSGQSFTAVNGLQLYLTKP